MSPVKASFKGLARVLSSPMLVLWLWLFNLVAALPLALVMAGSIESSIGASLVQQKLREGFDMGWFGEYHSRAEGIETTLSPSVVGVGAFLDNVEAWFDGGLFESFRGLAAVGVLYAVVWALFLGGVLHRLGGGAGMFRLSEFLSQGGAFFFRFFRLAVLSGVLYYLVYRFSAWMFGRIQESTRDVTVEKTVLTYVILAAVLVVVLLAFVNMAFDYAKIATFKENRRSMVLAALKGFGFVLGNLGKTWTLYLGLGLVGVFLLGVYWLVAPGPGQATALGVAVAFLVGQAYLVAKLVLRLTFYAGEMSLYESAEPGR
jgi:hypothetical protein